MAGRLKLQVVLDLLIARGFRSFRFGGLLFGNAGFSVDLAGTDAELLQGWVVLSVGPNRFIAL